MLAKLLDLEKPTQNDGSQQPSSQGERPERLFS